MTQQLQQQQYRVNSKLFDSIESAGEYMLTLKHKATMEVYTPPSAASINLSIARNMLIREMLEWAGSFTQSMSPSTDVDWMYSFNDDEGNGDAGDCYYEDLTNVTYGTNQVWEDAQHDYTSAVNNFESLLGNYNEYDSVEKLSEMLNSMYHTMSDHSSETDSYICEVRHSVKQMCEASNSIAHSYHEPSRTTTISFCGNIDSMCAQYTAQRDS